MSKHVVAKPQDHDPARPETFGRRILLLTTGETPQVVTETLYALAVEREPPFVPTEIYLVTTQKGFQVAKRDLLDPGQGKFFRLCADYKIPPPKFDAFCIRVLPGADIRTAQENEMAADDITEVVREFTRDAGSALHVSIAGGRKSMGFYLGTALSFFARPQDRLSHVLADPPGGNFQDFYYPLPLKKGEKLIPGTRGVDFSEIPFVQLRRKLSDDDPLFSGKLSYTQMVAALQAAIGPKEIVIDIGKRTLHCGGKEVSLQPINLTWYLYMARRKLSGDLPVAYHEVDENEFLDAYLDIQHDNSSDYEALQGTMAKWGEAELKKMRIACERKGVHSDVKREAMIEYSNMKIKYFEGRQTLVLRAIKQTMGNKAEGSLYFIHGEYKQGYRHMKFFEIQLPAEQIKIIGAHSSKRAGGR